MDGYISEAQAELFARHGITPTQAAQLLESGAWRVDKALSRWVERYVRAGGPRLVERSLSADTVHVDRPLSNLAVEIRNREFVADGVLPVIPVEKPSDKYFKWNADTMYEEQASLLVGPESMPGRVRYQLSTDNFSCLDYGLMDFVGYKEEAAADAPIVPRRSATRIVTNRLLLARERRAATLVFGSGNYGSNTAALTGADRWDQSSSDPAQQIDDAIESCDVRPNVMVLGAQVWQKVRNHPKLKEMIFGRAAVNGAPSPTRVTLQLLAEAFDLDAVYVGRAKYNTNREGATSARGYVWGKSVALIRVTAAPDMRETDTFGYTFRLRGSLQTQVIENLLPGLLGGVYVKVTMSDAEKSVAGSNAGYLYTTVVS